MGYYLLDTDYDSLSKTLEFDETEKVICNRFKDIDFQFKRDKIAEIIFSADFLNNPDGNKRTTLHWYYVGEVLKEKYKYVAMERLDKDYNSVEKELQRIGYNPCSCWAVLALEDIQKINVSHFKFIIWKNQLDFNRDYDRKLRQYFDF